MGKLTRKISRFIINHKLIVFIIFAVLVGISAVFIPFVKVNYNETVYLPNSSSTRQGIEAMNASFGEGGNATVMIDNVSIAEAMRVKNEISLIKGRRTIDGKFIKKEKVSAVEDILWIDSLILSEEFGLLKKVDFEAKNGEAEPGLYSNVEMVAYVWEIGKVIIDGKVEFPEISAETSINEILPAIGPFKDKLSTYITSKEFKDNVLESNPSEEKGFFDKLFLATEDDPNSSQFVEDIWLDVFLALGQLMTTGDFAGLGGFDLDMITDQLSMFWVGNDGGKTGDIEHSGSALFQVMFKYSDHDDATGSAITQIRKMEINPKVIGNAAVISNSANMVEDITMYSMILALIIVVVILLVMTTSYWEPVILLLTIGGAIILNAGTNIFMGHNGISYMTNGVASVLQLALTMDYSIYILNRFKQEKQKGISSNEAMVEALSKSFNPVSSSSFTTMASFVALCFMSYRMGLDMGLVLLKGVIFSLLSVFLFLPPLILISEKLIYKTTHKTFNFKFKRFSKFLIKTRFYIPVLIVALIIPSMIFQRQNHFTYGQEGALQGAKSEIKADLADIKVKFGDQNQVVILIPDSPEYTSWLIEVGDNEEKRSVSRETYLWELLSDIKIKNKEGRKLQHTVQSYQELVDSGAGLIMPAKLKGQFVAVSDEGKHITKGSDGSIFEVSNNILIAENGERYEYKDIGGDKLGYVLVNKNSENILGAGGGLQTLEFHPTTYRRMVLFLPVEQEGEETTKVINEIEDRICKVYGPELTKEGSDLFILGLSPATLEIKEIVNNDYNMITYISLALVFLTLLFAFKSLLLPIIMIVVIQGSIYLNMVVPYIMGEKIVFIGYMMVSAILLGATIDYAIVLSSHYMEARARHNKYDSIQHAMTNSARTLFTSGGILLFAGVVVNITNKDTSPATATFGSMVARGGIASLLLVFILLPQLLIIFDSLIRKTTYKGKQLMVDKSEAEALYDIVEEGLVKKEKKKKTTLTRREQAVMESILNNIYDENYDPDQFSFSEMDLQEILEDSKQKEDLKEDSEIDLFKTLKESLAEQETDYKEYFNVGELEHFAREQQDIDEEGSKILAEKQPVLLHPLNPEDAKKLALQERVTQLSLLDEEGEEEAPISDASQTSFSAIYDILSEDKEKISKDEEKVSEEQKNTSKNKKGRKKKK